MSSFPRSFLPEEERPCNDVVKRILSTLSASVMRKVESALGTKDVFQKLLVEVESEAIQLLGTSDLLESLEQSFYRADDLLDKLPRGDGEKMVRTSYRLNKLALKIKEILKELVEKRDREFRFYLSHKNPSKVVSIPSEDFVGRVGDKEAILKFVLQENKERNVVDFIPIVGPAGCGKTELVKAIFNDEQVQGHFESRVWLSGFDSLELDFLSQSKSFNLLEEKEGDSGCCRFLVVVDQVCFANDLPKLEFLRDLLRRGAIGSRVIITTRSEEVVKACFIEELDYSNNVYRLNSLDEQASLSLFRAKFFKDEKELENSNENLDEIVKKCRGNLSVIKMMESIIWLKGLGIEKQSYSQKEMLRMSKKEVEAIMIIKSSYKNLSIHLKPCFAYCGLFPKRQKLEVEKLVNLWISQGFVESFDVGYNYFTELFERCIIEEVERDESGIISKCEILNIFHDISKQVVGTEYSILSLDEGEEERETISSKTRHVSLNFHLVSPWKISDVLFKANKIRTILLPSQLHWQIEGRSGTSICDTIVSNFKLLRALDLHNSGLKIISKLIGKFKHLRYLDLSQNTDINFLPNSICELSNLQTLKLNFCGRLEKLPKGMKKLANLRNLELDSCYSLTHMPRGIGQLTNLRTLSEFVVNNEDTKGKFNDLAELKGLNELRGESRIKNLRCGVGQANLHEKSKLRSLVLSWDTKLRAHHSIEGLEPHRTLKEVSLFGFRGDTFHSWLASHENLVKFSMWKCLKCKNLQALDLLPRLKVLSLEDLVNLEHIELDDTSSRESGTFFPTLQQVRLVDLPKFRGFSSSTTMKNFSFPCLLELTVEDCPKLESVPLSAELQALALKNTTWRPFSSNDHSLSKLKTLQIACSSIVGLEENLPRLGNIQSITFDNLPYVDALPHSLSRVAGLLELHVWRCNDLKDISECIMKGLKSLKKVSFKLCLNLELPLKTIALLASTAKLEIEDCPRIQNVINSPS